MSSSNQNTASSTRMTFDDQHHWNAFRSGDEVSFTKIATHYYRHLVHYGSKFTPNRQIIEDALQDLLIHLWLHRASVGETPSPKFYMMKAFRHQLFKNLKRAPSSQSIDCLDGNVGGESCAEDDLIRAETERETRDKFNTLLNALPARHREVLYLRYYQGFSIDEIARLLDIKPQSVSNIVQRSLTKLREHWPVGLLLPLLSALVASLHNFQA